MKNIYLTIRVKSLFSVFLFVILIFSFVYFLISEKIEKNDDYAGQYVMLEKNNPVIIIDAGHGGEDGGTQSADGILEKDINLSISRKLDILLKLMGYNTVMVRDDDILIYDENCNSVREKKSSDLKNRKQISEKYFDGIFISIHQNYFTESKYSGAQVFYSPNCTGSEKLASSVQSSIVELLQPSNTRKTKASGSEIYLLYNIQTPAIMIECGFLSNQQEALLLNNEEYQRKLTLAILNGIEEYLKF